MATEEEPQTQEQVRTAADVRLDALEQEIAEMKAAHAKQVEELMEANRGLYAMLQSRPDPTPEPTQEPEQVPGPDPAIAAMNAALGIKEV
jgi:hypothetical protein